MFDQHEHVRLEWRRWSNGASMGEGGWRVRRAGRRLGDGGTPVTTDGGRARRAEILFLS